MRILQLHCDRIEYSPVKKEIAAAEEPATGGKLEDAVLAFVAVEKGDGPGEAARAAAELRQALGRIGCKKLLIYPYAHLSSTLAAPSIALGLISEMEAALHDLEVSRAPFGWTKSYTISVKGHPLAEGFKVITGDARGTGAPKALESESSMKSTWHVLTPDGNMTDASEFDFAGCPKLKALARYEASKKRGTDEPPPHVALMKRMGIADYEPASDAGNMKFFPNGRLIKSLIERYVTERVVEYGGYEVETPIMYDSNHPSMVSYFNRFPARQYSIDSEGKSLFLRFAACFGQFLMAGDYQLSYKNLPFRLYELTRYSFRREQSGELVGLRRLRAFTMPDCHAFCTDMAQAVREAGVRFELSRDVIGQLGLDAADYEMAIRLTEEFYAENGGAVREMVRRHGRPVLVEMWKERFFYFVLKWEFNYIDGAGKASALSTDQIDVENGKRYGIEFVDENNGRQHPVILHNSPSGAIERVIYTLLEKAAADSARGTKPELPLWLSPVQARIIPVGEELVRNATELAKEMAGHGIRADVDDRNESMGKRIREAEKEWVRYILVVGEKEAASGRLSVRDRRTGKSTEMGLDDLVEAVREQTAGKPSAGLNSPFYLSKRPQVML
ncbi:threonyl-tRNA synthetase [Cenarchaeum symbiosum A]|uniref:Threonine--tRNA ligase n=1 Tax=Cenarchaeum symbiosum (strain A) TaxID=414004 RepID=SYT_CENSY|nr:RecName: Full=Threonine--tRNA ligase; AltName: Full=Threonyl-tRNA synthetase; Short=ThrRS [Cenarchaeum symbiosum A]ABK76893.1 threonyl-tRNA synthetase [Cenarchaeum symbiosum A]